MLKVIVSNNLEFLIHALGDFLFLSSKSLIQKNLLVTPSRQNKNFLRPYLAKKHHMITGVEFCSLEQALLKILSSTQAREQPLPHFPSQGELFLWLYPLLLKAKDSTLPIFQPLKTYLKEEEELQARLKYLAQQLSYLFPLYLHYGQSFLLNPKQLLQEDRWQVQIFNQLMEKLNISNFDWPKVLQEVNKCCRCSSPTYQKLAIYALNFLPAGSFQLLKTLSSYLEIRLYLFSPCTKFWTDSLSDSQLLLSSAAEDSDDFEFYLNHRNPLISNWGGVLRNRIRLLENEKTAEVHFLNPLITEKSRYHSLALSSQDFQAIQGPKHLLGYLQHDLLLLRYQEPKKSAITYNLDSEEQSLELHICSSPLREVEVLHQNLLNYLQAHNSLAEEPILILAPDIEPYRPFIEHVFYCSEHKLPFTFFHSQEGKQHSLKHGLYQLLSLAYETFSPQKLLDFLIHPLVKKQLSFSFEELQILMQCLKSHTMHWGLNKEQQSYNLQKNLHKKIALEDLKGDTLSCLQHLLRKIVERQAEIQVHFRTPDMSQSLILGKILGIIEKLGQDLEPIFLRKSLPLHQWLEILTCYLRTYFYLGEEHYILEEAKELFKRLQLPDELSKEVIEFDLLWPFLQEALKPILSSALPQKETLVKIGSFHELIGLPAQAIFCLGMSQESFPGEEKALAFNLLKKNPGKDYFPTHADLQRSYFLEKLISTKEKIFFSYSPSGKPEEKASSLVQELFNYIDQHFLLKDNPPSKSLIKEHPDSCLDLKYFSHYPQEKNFEQAKAKLINILSQKSKNPHILPLDLSTSIPKTLRLSSLENAFKNPLKNFFKTHYDISFFDSLAEIAYDEDGIQLKPIEKYWIQDPHDLPLEEKWEVLSQKKSLFFSPLTKAIWQNAKEEVTHMHNLIQKQGYSLQEIYTLHLCEKNLPLQSHLKHKFIPPVAFSYLENSLHVLASFPCMYQQTLLISESLKASTIIKMFPKLFFFFLALSSSENTPRIIFLENNKVLHLTLDQVKPLFNAFLHYYFKSLSMPSGLFPELIPALIEENPHTYTIALQNLQENHLKKYTKSSFNWTYRNFPFLFDYSYLLENWKNTILNPLSEGIQICLEHGENL